MRVRWLAFAVLAIAMLNVALFLTASARLTAYPFSLEYGEGGMLWQASHVFDLKSAYHPLGQYPYVMFLYLPGYHALTAAVAAVVGDLLFAGRLVSLFCALTAAILSASLARRMTSRPGGARVAWIAAPLVVWQLTIVTSWVPVMRVDMAAVCFNLLGLVLFLRARGWAGRLASGLSLVLAVFCKQTAIVGSGAVLATIALTEGVGAAVAFGVPMIAMASAALGILVWRTDGQILEQVFLYNQSSFDLAQLRRLVSRNLTDTALLMPLVGVPIAETVLRPRRSFESKARLCVLLYWLLSGFACLGAVRAGAGLNYFLEWNIACAILAASALGELLPWRTDGRATRGGVMALVAAGLFCVSQLPGAIISQRVVFGRDRVLNDRALASRRLVEEIRTAASPVMSEDILLSYKAGREAPLETATVAQLARTGAFDERLILDRLASHEFAFIIVQALDSPLRYSERMRRAIRESYPVVEDAGGGYTILRPR